MPDFLSIISTKNPLLLIMLAAWSLPWKGVALWRAAQKKQLWWFVAIFLTNTLAILEILYIFFFSKNKKRDHSETGDK